MCLHKMHFFSKNLCKQDQTVHKTTLETDRQKIIKGKERLPTIRINVSFILPNLLNGKR